MAGQPTLSVIVISHNRAARLAECVRTLHSQLPGRGESELIVVLDSCNDGSLEVLHSLHAEIRSGLRVQPIQANSPALSRNQGAKAARGSILLFLDDDILPSCGFVEAHLRAQRQSDVVVGNLRQEITTSGDWWQLGARIWWEDRFSVMSRSGYELEYRDLFSANFSIKRALFRTLGGFDADCPRLEDYEFAIRVLKAGASLSYSPEASGIHRDGGTLSRWLHRASVEAMGELHIGRKHPDFRKSVFQDRILNSDPLVRQWRARIRGVAFRRSRLRSAAVRAAESSLPFLQSIKARQSWRHLMGAVHDYHYWTCIARHFSSESDFLSWVDE